MRYIYNIITRIINLKQKNACWQSAMERRCSCGTCSRDRSPSSSTSVSAASKCTSCGSGGRVASVICTQRAAKTQATQSIGTVNKLCCKCHSATESLRAETKGLPVFGPFVSKFNICHAWKRPIRGRIWIPVATYSAWSQNKCRIQLILSNVSASQ